MWGPEQGRELAALREDAGLRQIDLARELGFSDSALRRYEQGLPPKESRQRQLAAWMDAQRQRAPTSAQTVASDGNRIALALERIADALERIAGK